MAKFILVEEAPNSLEDGEIVINMPDFVEEIEMSKRFASKLGGRTVTQLFHLKNIANNIGQAYDPEGFDPYTSIPFSRYEGIEFADAKDLSNKVVLKMFANHYPQIVDRYLDKVIKSRPADTKVIYFTGSEANIKPFIENGIDQCVSEKNAVLAD